MNHNILILKAAFNANITDALETGTLNILKKNDAVSIKTTVVPGAFELPAAAAKAASTGRYSAIICIGAVIRGETYHFEVVSDQSACGIREVSQEFQLPVINGVLTLENVQQAFDRCGVSGPNHGEYFGQAALDMIQVMHDISHDSLNSSPQQQL